MDNLVLLYNILWVCCWAYLGVFARVGLASVAEGNILLNDLGSGYFLPNMLGSLIMGLSSTLQDQHNPFFHAFVGKTLQSCANRSLCFDGSKTVKKLYRIFCKITFKSLVVTIE